MAHRRGVTVGEHWENCRGGFSVTIGQIIQGRNPLPLAQGQVNDIWVQGGFHSGIVTAVRTDATGQTTRATVDQCNTRGSVAPIDVTQGSFYR